MKLRRHRIQIEPPKVEVTNEEIMRDLLFPAVPRVLRLPDRAASRR